MTTIIQLSDTHVTEPGRLAYGRVDTRQALIRAVAHLNALPDRLGPIDGVVLTGDLTDHATPGEYTAFRALIAPLRIPLFVIPGNHDARGPMREAFADAPYLPAEGPLHWHQRIGEVDVIGLDTTVPGAPHGTLGQTGLGWLEHALSETADRPCLVFTHHPPFDTGIAHMDRMRLRDGDAFLALVARHPQVLLVGSGHVHRMIASVESVPCVIAPAPAHAVCLDHGSGAEPAFAFEPGAVLAHVWQPSPTRRFGRVMSQLSYIEAHDGPHSFAAGSRPSRD
ncbi:MAG: phosphodiesterase [Pseudomonadota bacterium]